MTMTVAEIVPKLGGMSLADSKDPAKSRKASAGGKDAGERLHGLNLQGIHPVLVPSIPSPEDFKASSHYPVVVTLNPFAGKQVRARAPPPADARRCAEPRAAADCAGSWSLSHKAA